MAQEESSLGSESCERVCKNPVKFPTTKSGQWLFVVLLPSLFGLVVGPRFARCGSTSTEEAEISSMTFEIPACSQFTLTRDTSLGWAILPHSSLATPLVPIWPTEATAPIAALVNVSLAGRSLGGCGG
jgi:hypothetical protein